MKILALAMALMTVAACTPLNAGDEFTENTNGIEWRYEVIVSHMTYVRVFPVASSDLLTGEISIPATITHDGTLYTVTQIGKNAFRNYTGITAVSLPSTISVIEENAFRNCTALAEINTPQPLSTIGDYAFDGCSSLQSFNFQASLSTLGKGCFRNCSLLEDLNITASLTAIPSSAFEGCASLTHLDLPATILQIGDKAISGCTGVEAVTCLAGAPPTCSANTFDGIATDIPVTVLMSNVSSFQAAVGWNRFTNYIGNIDCRYFMNRNSATQAFA